LTLASAQRLAEKQVEFVTFRGKQFGGEVRALGYPVHEVAVRIKLDLLAVVQMRAMIRRGEFDVVHTHLSTSSVVGCLAARMARVPCVATVHGLSGKLSFVFADHLIAVSNEVKAHLMRQAVAGERISVVHNGLPMDRPIPGRVAARRALGLPVESTILGTVSRITANKGIDDAIHLVAELIAEDPQLRYLLVGDGDALEGCRLLAGQLGIGECVSFLGYRTNVDECLAAMDLFVFPSRKEAMGIALVEAMRAGLPTVAYSTGGIPEVVTAGCGTLVPPGDLSALTDAARTILSDGALARQMSEVARSRARSEFSDTAMEKATAVVYARAMEQRRAATFP
jgi:glycosyltransferase involved in cell wall biosynthesis